MTRHASKLALLALAAPGAAMAQIDLFSNGSPNPSDPGIATGTTSFSGAAVPAGGQWSEAPHTSLTNANAIAGFSGHSAGPTGSYRFAEDLVVPAGGWRIDAFSFYAYQPGANLSPASALAVRVWTGRPGDPGSAVIAGNLTTNVLVGASATNTYRIFNSLVAPFPIAPDTTRRVWRFDAALMTGFGGPINLAEGTYWLEWQFTPVTPSGEVFTPPVTAAGSRGPLSANARQFKPAMPPTLGDWSDVIDPGKPATAVDLAQALPFIVRGGPACFGDLNGDGTVDFNDFLIYLNAYNAGDPIADLNGDGTIDFNDLLEFLNMFNTPCG